MNIICMIPARLGSQRLEKKNLLQINEKSLVKLCAEKCLGSNVFSEVYINSESELILREAPTDCRTYKRSSTFANSEATSEDFVRDFLDNIECDYLFQVHTIAPLVSAEEIISFVNSFIGSGKQVGLCYEKVILETVDNNERPVNFSYYQKENSQDLAKLKKINWCMTGWKVKDILEEECISFGTKRYFHEVSKLSGFVIKTMEDYLICKKLMEK